MVEGLYFGFCGSGCRTRGIMRNKRSVMSLGTRVQNSLTVFKIGLIIVFVTAGFHRHWKGDLSDEKVHLFIDVPLVLPSVF